MCSPRGGRNWRLIVIETGEAGFDEGELVFKGKRESSSLIFHAPL
jgi:hypothetical protein